MSKIADYDTLDYNYQTYWANREYENMAEHAVLKKIFKKKSGNWFLDIGGSYGRLTDTYYDKYKKSVIVDYSLKTLQKNFNYLKDNYPYVQLIAANAYNLPFKENSFDGALMVRVLHHIEDPNTYFKEVYRILKSNSSYIQEFANKLHLKAFIKALFTLNFSIFSKEPYQQPTQENFEGARKGVSVPFFNYHYSWIKEALIKQGFKIEKKYGCSFFRVNVLKKIFGSSLLLIFENLFQTLFSWSNISPSIFVDSTVLKEKVEGSKDFESIQEILVCPNCKETLIFTKEKAVCENCKKEYLKKENIWDFRV